MNPLIFTSYNDDIDPRFPVYHEKIMKLFDLDCWYKPLWYKFHHTEMLHGDILNRYINKAFYELGHDCILILDVDCIPLSRESILDTLELAYNGYLVGNIQRSHHIQNDEHLYAASSFICFSEKTFRDAGRPNMLPSYEGDTCEQFTYNMEKVDRSRIILYNPYEIESCNEKGEYWGLKSDDTMKYGIGTTFSWNDKKINYHLFGSRLKIFDELFFEKCNTLLGEYYES